MRLLDVRSTIPSLAFRNIVLESRQKNSSYVVWLSNLVENFGKQLAASRVGNKYQKGLILAQNERWRRGLGMQVEREPARGTAANGVGQRR